MGHFGVDGGIIEMDLKEIGVSECGLNSSCIGNGTGLWVSSKQRNLNFSGRTPLLEVGWLVGWLVG